MKVAEALIDPRYLSRSHAIQYRLADDSRATQVSVSYDGNLFAVQRRPLQGSEAWPAWRSTRGSGSGRDGHFGLWLPHIPDLMSECELVPLAADDRPPAHQRYRYIRGEWPVEDGAPIVYPLGTKS